MKMFVFQNVKYAFFAVFALMILSCHSASKDPEENVRTDENSEAVSAESASVIINRLLSASLHSDTIQMYNVNPFIFYKTGKLFDIHQQHSLIVTCPDDSSYCVKIYQLLDSLNWGLVDSMAGLKADKLSFYIESKDYNFDSQADLYIQNDYSGDYPMSRGHVILIDPKTKKMRLNRAMSSLYNFYADPSAKIVRSEAPYPQKTLNGNVQIWVKKSHWVKGELLTMDSTLERIVK